MTYWAGTVATTLYYTCFKQESSCTCKAGNCGAAIGLVKFGGTCYEDRYCRAVTPYYIIHNKNDWLKSVGYIIDNRARALLSMM